MVCCFVLVLVLGPLFLRSYPVIMVMAWLAVHPQAADEVTIVISTVIFLAQNKPFAFPTICKGTELFFHTVESVTVPLITMVINSCYALDMFMISSRRVSLSSVATRSSVNARWTMLGITRSLDNFLFSLGLARSDKG